MSGPLDSLPQEVRDSILALVRRRTLAAADIIFRQGEPATGMALIAWGRVGLTVASVSGEVAALAVLGPGDTCGEEALLPSPATHIATATALQPAEILVLSRPDFERLRAGRPDVVALVLATLLKRLEMLSEKLVSAMYVPAKQRVLREVLELSRVYGGGSAGSQIELSQHEVAAFAGVARATANRILRQAEEDGLLQLGRSRLKVLDPDSLALRAGVDVESRQPAGAHGRATAKRLPAPPQHERRPVAVVQAEVGGLASVSDPEQAAAIADAFFSAVEKEVAGEGGTVDRPIMGKVIAVFGARRARGDDAARAVRAALRIAQLAPGRLAIRVGVESGEALVTASGAEQTSATGAVVAVAGELVAAAAPGQVLVGRDARSASRRLIRYEKTLAGHWLATGEQPPEILIASSPLTGRNDELTFLESIWRRVQAEKRPQLITVVGPPGIGKTRLALELAARVAAGGGRVVRGRSLPSGGGLASSAFAQQAKALADIADSDTPSLARHKLRKLAAELVGSAGADEMSGNVAFLLGLGGEEPTSDRSPLFTAARRLIEAAGARQPHLFVFEDVHWSDPALLDLLESLAGRVRDVPVLFFALARPELLEIRPGWGSAAANHSRLELLPLADDDSRNLAEALLKDVRSAGDLIPRLVERSGGNPLFIEELAAAMSEGGEGAFQKLPTTVSTAIAARIDALPDEARALIRDASVVGKIFWAGALRGMTGKAPSPEVLDLLEDRGLIRREVASRFAGDVEFSFKHILIREVVYASLPRSARQERHLAAARFIERAAGERAPGWAGVLAHHYVEAEQPDRAARYFVFAADEAALGWAKGETVVLLGRALELLPENDVRRRASIELRRASALVDVGDYRTAVAELKRILPALEGRQRVDALLGLAEATMWLEDQEGPHVYARDAESLARELGDQELRAAGLARLSHALSMVGKTQASLSQGEEAISLWQPGVRSAELAYHLELTGLCYYWTDNYERAIDLLGRAYQLGNQVQSVRDLVRSGGSLGMTFSAAGRNVDAEKTFADVLAKGRELEQVPRWTSRAMNMWAGALRDRLDIVGARRMNQEALELAGTAAFNVALLQSRIDLLFCDLAEGEAGRADAAWPELQEMCARAIGHHRWLMDGRLAEARAEIDLQLGRPADAANSATHAIEVARQAGRRRYEVAARMALGRAFLALGRSDDALSELRRSMRDAVRIKNPHLMWRAGLAVAAALDARGDDAAAATTRARARKVAARIGVIVTTSAAR